ncbi:MAG: hypothetical protein GX166_01455 [Clostridiaceae bacterium]|nr:hypothetical protein [Clostridiaceae bacterium]
MKMAEAYIFGSDEAPGIIGMVRFYVLNDGYTRLDVDIKGLALKKYSFNIKNGDSYILPDLVTSEGRARMSFYTKDIGINDVLAKKIYLEGDNKIVASGTIRKVVYGKKSYSE